MFFLDFSAKTVNFEKTDNKDWEIRDDTFHVRYGEVKWGLQIRDSTPSSR